MSTYKIITMT